MSLTRGLVLVERLEPGRREGDEGNEAGVTGVRKGTCRVQTGRVPGNVNDEETDPGMRGLWKFQTEDSEIRNKFSGVPSGGRLLKINK